MRSDICHYQYLLFGALLRAAVADFVDNRDRQKTVRLGGLRNNRRRHIGFRVSDLMVVSRRDFLIGFA
jgi:hypothetical protein